MCPKTTLNGAHSAPLPENNIAPARPKHETLGPSDSNISGTVPTHSKHQELGPSHPKISDESSSHSISSEEIDAQYSKNTSVEDIDHAEVAFIYPDEAESKEDQTNSLEPELRENINDKVGPDSPFNSSVIPILDSHYSAVSKRSCHAN